MRNLIKRCHFRHGSVIIVVVCIFVVLIIFLASFMKSATSRTHSTKKIGDTLLARELANSLAITSFHYIRNIELKNEGSELRKSLSEPIEKLSNSSGSLIDGIKANMKNGSGNVIDILLNNSGLQNIKLDELNWKIYKDDFTALKLGDKDSPFLREKSGVIRVSMKLSYKLSGQKDATSEYYLFAAPISIVANIIPVLSKFNFYVKDVFGGNRPSDEKARIRHLNVVKTTAGGALLPHSPIPWIMKNGDDENYCTSYKDFVKSKKGFIYLGGGNQDNPVTLGIARGFSGVTQGDYGEDFHFFKKAKGGYWKTHETWGDKEGILSANIGLCDDETTDNLIAWQVLFGDGYKEMSKINSIFRLYGTDAKGAAPTLVLGHVNSMSGEARAYKNTLTDNTVVSNRLVFWDKEEDFSRLSGLQYEIDDYTGLAGYMSRNYNFTSFASAYIARPENQSKSIHDFYVDYCKNYSSKIIEHRYNHDYAYLLAKAKNKDDDSRAYPLEYCTDLINNELKNLCSMEDNNLFAKIPICDEVRYDKIYDNDEIDRLEIFFNKDTLFINGSEDSDKKARIAHEYKYSDEEGLTFKEFLTFKSLLYKGSDDKDIFDPNGWIYIESSNNSVKLSDYKSISQGGFIIAGKDDAPCNVDIDGDLTGEHLTIIVLKGDMNISRNAAKLNASLIIPNGQLILEDGDELNITGNIVMNELKKSNIDNNFKRALNLTYKEELSAWPYNDKADKVDYSELPLLMFDLKEKIVMLD